MWAEIAIAIASLAVLAEPGPPEPVAEPEVKPRVEWRQSAALGLPEAGRLVDGVRLPAEGRTYFTWDPVLKRRPDRDWRRWATDDLVRTALGVVRDLRRRHPHAPRVGSAT